MDTPKKIAGISSTRVFSIRALCSMIILVFLAMGCRLASHIPSLKNGFDPITETPTTFEEPIFRDDFNGQLNPAWEWENEDPSRYKVNEDGWLEIMGGGESILAGGRQTNLLWITLPKDDSEISIHLKSQPLFDFQRAGLLLYKDSEHYISLSHGYCMQCVLGGDGIFLEYNLNGSQGRYTATANAVDLYLMLVSEQGTVRAFYAIESGQWQHLASLENNIHFKHVSLTVTNDSEWDNGYDIVGMFDYFEIRRPTQCAPTPTPMRLEQG